MASVHLLRMCEKPPAPANHSSMPTFATTATADTDAAFLAQVARHRGIVLKIAAGYSRGPDDRAELAQEILAQLWRAWPGYSPARPFSTWMYRIALNVAIGSLRNSTRHDAPLALDEHADIADPNPADPEREQQVRALHRFIAALPPLERALMLLYLDERPQREIAEVLGLSESNVSTKIGRLKQRLRDEL